MDFRLSESQIGLQEMVARFCADRFPLDGIAAREGQPADRGRWRAMAELGVFGLMLAEDAGGSGLGAVDAALVFEQLGSHLVPGPLLWTVLGASVVEGAATGERRVGGVDGSAAADVPLVVEHAAEIDVLLVLAADGVVAHRMADLPEPIPLDPLDPLTPIGALAELPGGDVVGGPDTAARLQVLGTVLGAALLAGVADRALEVARAYALEREQFGVPIGSFQAVKHLLADMYVRTGLAQSATYAAAAVVDDPRSDDPALAASAAKVLAADAAIANAGTAIQVLGGMGFTWEMLPNHLLKRSWVLELGFGSADEHALHRGTAFGAERGEEIR